MDAQERLTRWEEWVVGAMYRWKKGGSLGVPMRCVEVSRREGFVRFEREGCPQKIRSCSWRGLFVRVPGGGDTGQAPGDGK